MPASKASLKIRTGVYRGECLGYCNEDMTVTPNEAVHVKYAQPKDPSEPEIVNEKRMSTRKWNKLVSGLDLEKFWELPRTIGDPDAADQGGEYLEISDGERTHRVDFAADADMSQIGKSVDELRELRRQLSTKQK